MRKVVIASLVFVSSLAILRMAVLAQTPTVELPFLVVKDAMGDVVGPVVQIDDTNRPVVLFRDSTDGGAPFFIQFSKDGFRVDNTAGFTEIYFTGVDCSGIAFIPWRDEFQGILLMRGTVYGVGANGLVYRTLRGGIKETVPTASLFTEGFVCVNNASNIPNQIEAIPALDLGDLVPPFTVE